MFDLASASLEELEKFLVSLGAEKFRGQQIFDWIHKKHVFSIEEMLNVSKGLRSKLTEKSFLPQMNLVKKEVSVDGTVKCLFELGKKEYIETVFMSYRHGNSVCISSQVGCALECIFCASTKGGFSRSLTTGEMLYQAYAMENLLGKKITHMVLMGSGEPLLNYSNVLKMLHLLNHEKGLHISKRHMTISTAGIIKAIDRLSEENLQITLAVSLHAPNNGIRKRLMPITITNPMDGLLEACKRYTEKTKRQITFEYILIEGVNSGREHAKELASRLKGFLCHVNLIPVNPIKEENLFPPNQGAIDEFLRVIESNRIPVSIRRELGGDIAASCGQLRSKFLGGRP